MRITVGSIRIDYPGKLTARRADLTTTKMMWNSVIGTKDARYACANIQSFLNLETPLDRPEYTKMAMSLISQENHDAYGIQDKKPKMDLYTWRLSRA